MQNYFQSRYRKEKAGKSGKAVSTIFIFFSLSVLSAFLLFFFFNGFQKGVCCQRRNKPGFRVFIDAGHYKGSLNGTQYKKRLEFEVTRLIALTVRSAITNDSPEWSVELSREDGYYTEKIQKYQEDNYKSLWEETLDNYRRSLIRYPHIKKWSKPVHEKWKKDRLNLITVRNYAEENADVINEIDKELSGIGKEGVKPVPETHPEKKEKDEALKRLEDDGIFINN